MFNLQLLFISNLLLSKWH